MASSAQGTQPQQKLPQQGKGPATSGQPTYQPIGVNNPPASYNPVAPVLTTVLNRSIVSTGIGYVICPVTKGI